MKRGHVYEKNLNHNDTIVLYHILEQMSKTTTCTLTTTQRKLAEISNLTISKVRTAVEHLIKAELISKSSANRRTKISVLDDSLLMGFYKISKNRTLKNSVAEQIEFSDVM